MFSIRAQAGMTLIELMVVTVIAAMIITIGVPALQRFSHSMQVQRDITQLSMNLRLARAQALQHTNRVTLCPLDSNGQCHNNWNARLSVFFDQNNNHRIDNEDQEIFNIPAVSSDQVKRDFNGSVISFAATGFAGFNTGSFSYCFKGAIETGAVFIISRIGRIRKGKDNNNDGIPETAGGNAIPCPS